jgi:hypothetical protein
MRHRDQLGGILRFLSSKNATIWAKTSVKHKEGESLRTFSRATTTWGRESLPGERDWRINNTIRCSSQISFLRRRGIRCSHWESITFCRSTQTTFQEIPLDSISSVECDCCSILLEGIKLFRWDCQNIGSRSCLIASALCNACKSKFKHKHHTVKLFGSSISASKNSHTFDAKGNQASKWIELMLKAQSTTPVC